jgi:hypothetical protein
MYPTPAGIFFIDGRYHLKEVKGGYGSIKTGWSEVLLISG